MKHRVERLEAKRRTSDDLIAFVNSDWDEEDRDDRVAAALAKASMTGRPVSLFPLPNQRHVEFMTNSEFQSVIDAVADDPAPRRVGVPQGCHAS